MDFFEEFDAEVVFLVRNPFSGFAGCNVDGFCNLAAVFNSFLGQKYPVLGARDSLASDKTVFFKSVKRSANPGYNCAGGVCRYVPASRGFQISYNYNF